MSSKIPKTGLADRMRSWMKASKGKFAVRDLCDGLNLPPGKERDKVRNALPDFLSRGEIQVVMDKRIRRQSGRSYRFNLARSISKKPADMRQKIYKAMRLISFHSPFAVADIVEYTGEKRSYIDKTVRRLVEEGHLRIDGSRRPQHGAGRETLYRVKDLTRFRLEVMK